MNTNGKRSWVRATKETPCRYCERWDNRCAVSEDGSAAVCYHGVNDGRGQEKADRNGNAYVSYRLGKPERGEERPKRSSRPGRERAEPEVLHRVYSALLTCGNTRLTEANRAELARRGFPEAEADRRKYRSRPSRLIGNIAHGLADEFGVETLLSVPGFFRNDRGALTLAGRPGLLIPARDLEGRIIALTCRPDVRSGAEGSKYFWLSSAGEKKGNGPSPGAPVHVPLGVGGPTDLIRVTEGLLKSDLAFILSGLPTIGVPGVGNWRGAVPILNALRARVVRVAYDADLARKHDVARALQRFIEALWDAGFEVEVEWWEEKDGKGIDDLLANGKAPEVLSGYEVEQLVSDIARSQSAETGGKGGRGSDGEDQKESQAEILLHITDTATLFHTSDDQPFASIPVGDHVEHHPIRSTSFRRWLTQGFYMVERKPPAAEALNGVLGVLEARAIFEGRAERVWTRIADAPDSTLDRPTFYLDLCNDRWQVVKITRDGWTVEAESPVMFRRSRGVQPLPVPERGGTLELLRKYVNVLEGDWPLLVACLAAALRPYGPYPIQAYLGEQGSAKSTTTRVVRRTSDPHVTLLRCAPREVRDLMIAATNAWYVALDNLSGLPVWLSDALCRLATGGGFATRTLYANDEETHFDAMRPVILNGIEDYASRDDLRDRCIFFHLPTIAKERRREEAPFWAEFESDHPRILGAILDAVCGGLRILPTVKLDQLPRMADFARWGESVGRAIGCKPGTFLKAYEANRGSAVEESVEDSPVASAIRALAESDRAWQGTATELLAQLAEVVGEEASVSKRWPKSPRSLSGATRRAAPALRTLGIDVTFERDSSAKRNRTITITRREAGGEQPSEPSEPSGRPAARAATHDCHEGPGDGMGSDAAGTEPPIAARPSERPSENGCGHNDRDINGIDLVPSTTPDGPDGPDDLFPHPSGPDGPREVIEL